MMRMFKGVYSVLLIAAISQLGCEKTTTKTEAFDAENGCFTCHTGTSEVGKKVLWAKAGWEESVHAQGFVKDITYVDANGDTQVIGQEFEGTDSFYANGSGCQVCHTGEGFLKKQNGEYADAEAIAADVITRPSSIGCFTCHMPHDTKDFSLTVADGTEVTLESGKTYSKTKGSLCASCHMMRLDGKTANESILAAVQSSGISSQRTAVHHGPQTDMLLGTPGATYAGKEYANSTHTTADGANCITCHFSFPETRAGLSPRVGGHSFDIINTVHGSDVASPAGCLTCHASAKAAKISGSDVGGYLKDGFAYIDKGSNGKAHIQAMNTVLTALADPDNGCAGLLEDAMVMLNSGDTTKGFTWSTDGRCVMEGIKSKVAKDASATDTSDITRVLKGIFNWGYAYFEDRSFGHHNATLSLQLLYDTCEDLADLTSNTTVDCGTRP